MGANRGACRRADRRHPSRILRRRVLFRLGDCVGIAGGGEPERIENVNLRDGDCVGNAAKVGCHAIGDRCSDAVAHLHRITLDCDAALRIDLYQTQ